MNENNKKNVDFVTESPRRAAHWKFVIRPEAGTVDELLCDTLDKLGMLFDLCAPFVTPTEIAYRTDTLPPDLTPAEAVAREEFDEHRIDGDSGVSFDQLASEIRTLSNEIRKPYLAQVEFVNLKTRIFLKEGDVYVDGTTFEKYRLESREGVVDSDAPRRPLLSILFRHGPSGRTSYAETTETVYRIDVGTASDVWFDNSPVACVNRNRLSNLLGGIHEQFDILSTRFTSDFLEYPDEMAEAIVFEEPRPESELIRDAEEYLKSLNEQ